MAVASTGTKQKNPNVILIMADDLGWADTGYNGHPRIKTPHLDDMAQNGVQFNRFYAAAPVCSPTRGSCLTGRNPYRYGIPGANAGHLKAEEVNLAEVMKAEGYRTGHFGKWHLGTLFSDFSGKGDKRNPKSNHMTPGMAGFDEWFSSEFAIATYDPYKKDKEHSHSKFYLEDDDRRAIYVENGKPMEEDLTGCDSKIIMDRAIPFIEDAVKQDKPFFTVIWFHAPHTPIVGHPKYMKELYSDLPEANQHFNSVVTALDAQVGRLRKKLKELGVAENTMVCFTSDNGPEGNPGPRGRSQGTAGKLRGRKRSLYEGGIRVPGIIEWPAVAKQHLELDMPAVTSDYFPTVCEALGYKMESDRPIDGVSLIDILKGKQQKRNKHIGFQYNGHKQKVMIGERYKLVKNEGKARPKSDNGSTPIAAVELYDIVNDPSETKNIASNHPEIVKSMMKELKAFVESCAHSNAGEDY
ncbi:N-acetylgalactosamine 6-sulfate sulfatase [Puteibacter caeruleilacunae]|nr:N-acetylgalactosamine 6-sulfate sulfatase [Puteibacter caeruleilacunae]